MSTLSWTIVLTYGLYLCLALSIVVIGSLMYNARVWLQDYPREIRTLVPPLTGREKRDQRLVMAPLLLLFFGIPYLAGRQFRLDTGADVTFLGVFLTVALVINIGNLWDALVIDLLVLGIGKPRFMVLPGTEHALHLYNIPLDKQFRDFLKGVVITSVLSLPIALLAML